MIVEGVAEQVTDRLRLRRFVDAYNPKYGSTSFVAGNGVTDPDGNVGPVYLVRPERAFGWTMDLDATATRWSFT